MLYVEQMLLVYPIAHASSPSSLQQYGSRVKVYQVLSADEAFRHPWQVPLAVCALHVVPSVSRTCGRITHVILRTCE